MYFLLIAQIGELRSAYFGASEELRAHGIDKEAQKRFKANVTTSGASADRLGAANRGVKERGSRDRAAEAVDTAHSQAVLNAKAKIYERIGRRFTRFLFCTRFSSIFVTRCLRSFPCLHSSSARGELPQESEEFLIDFQRKGWENIEMDGHDSTSGVCVFMH